MAEKELVVRLRAKDELGRALPNVKEDLKQVEEGMKNVGSAADQASSQTSSFFTSMLSTASGVLAAGVFTQISSGIMGVVSAGISGNAQFEDYGVRLTTLIRNSADFKTATAGMTDQLQVNALASQKATEELKNLAHFGAVTPFDLPQVVQASTELRGFGLYSEEAAKKFGASGSDILTIAGNVASGTGASFQEMAGLIGKFSAGATGQAITRFEELGVTTRDELTKMGLKFSQSGQLLSPLPEAMNTLLGVMKDKYGGLMDAQSATFGGMKSNLDDAIGGIERTLSKPIFDAMHAHFADLLNFLGSDQFTSVLNGIATAVGDSLSAITNAIQGAVDIMSGIWGQIGAPIMEIIGQAHDWGTGIVGSLAQGMMDGLPDVTGSINAIGATITDLLQTHSPPKILPRLKDWGQGAREVYMQGWDTGDFKVFDNIKSEMSGLIQNLVDTKAIPKDGFIPMLLGSENAVAQALNSVDEAGNLTQEAMAKIRAAAGPAAERIIAYAEAELQAKARTVDLAVAQHALTDENNAYNKSMADSNDRLKDNTAQQTTLTNAYNKSMGDLKDRLQDNAKAQTVLTDAYTKNMNALKDHVQENADAQGVLTAAYNKSMGELKDRLQDNADAQTALTDKYNESMGALKDHLNDNAEAQTRLQEATQKALQPFNDQITAIDKETRALTDNQRIKDLQDRAENKGKFANSEGEAKIQLQKDTTAAALEQVTSAQKISTLEKEIASGKFTGLALEQKKLDLTQAQEDHQMAILKNQDTLLADQKNIADFASNSDQAKIAGMAAQKIGLQEQTTVIQDKANKEKAVLVDQANGIKDQQNDLTIVYNQHKQILGLQAQGIKDQQNDLTKVYTTQKQTLTDQATAIKDQQTDLTKIYSTQKQGLTDQANGIKDQQTQLTDLYTKQKQAMTDQSNAIKDQQAQLTDAHNKRDKELQAEIDKDKDMLGLATEKLNQLKAQNKEMEDGNKLANQQANLIAQQANAAQAAAGGGGAGGKKTGGDDGAQKNLGDKPPDTGPVTTAMSAVSGHVGMLHDKFMWFINEIRANFDPVFKAAAVTVLSFGQLIGSILGMIKGAWDDKGESFVGALVKSFHTIELAVRDTMVNAYQIINSILGWVTDLFNNYGKGMLDSAMTTFTAIQTTVADVFGAVMGIVQGVMQVIQSVLDDHGTEIQQQVATVWNNIQGIYTAVWNGIHDTVVPILTAIGDFIKAHHKEIGDVIFFALNLIAHYFNYYTGIIKFVVESVLGAIRGFWKDHGEQIKTAVLDMWEKLKTTFEVRFAEVKVYVEHALKIIKDWWHDHGEEVKAIVTDFWDKIKGFFSGAFDFIKDVLDKDLKFVKGLWHDHGEETKGTVTDFFDKVKGFFTDASNFVKGKVSDALDLIKGWWKDHGEQVKTTIQTMFDDAKKIFDTVTGDIKKIVDGFLKLVEDWWDKHGKSVKHIASKLWDDIQAAIDLVIGPIKKTISDALDLIKGWWKDHGDDVIKTAKDLWDGISGKVTDIVTTVKNTISNGLDLIKGFFNDHKTTIEGVWNDCWDAIKLTIKTITDDIGSIVDAFSAALDGNWSGPGGVTEILQNAWNTTWDAIKGVLTKAVDAIKLIIQDIIQSIQDKFNAVNWGDLGQSVIDGITAAITGGAWKIAGAVTGAIGGAFDAGKKFLNSNSPSRKAHDELGAPLGEGVVTGVDSTAGKVADAGRNMMMGAFGGAQDAHKAQMAQLMQTISNTTNNQTANNTTNNFNMPITTNQPATNILDQLKYMQMLARHT